MKCIEDEIPFEIPDGWEWERLGNVANIARGGSPRPIDAFITDDENGVNWIKIGDTEKDGKYISSTKEKIIPEGVSKSRYVHSGDFLLTNSMSFGRPYILRTNGCIHDGWLVIGDIEHVFDQDYLYYALSSSFMFQSLSLKAVGSTVKNLKSDSVKTILFPIPSFNEQKRIADYSEKLLENINKISDSKDDLLLTVDATKAKIFDLAIRGKLVPQDPDDEPASMLLDRIRSEKEELIKQGKLKRDKKESIIYKGDDNSYFEKIDEISTEIDIYDDYELPTGWEYARLKNICTKIIDGAHNPPKGTTNKTPYIMASSRNIAEDTITDLENVRYLNKESFIKEHQRTNVSVNDVLLTTVATLGRCSIYSGEPQNLTFQRSVSVITTLIDPVYLKLFFDSPLFQHIINAEATGTAQKGFYLNQLEDVIVPIPPLSEQQQITSLVKKYNAQLIAISSCL